VSRPHYFKCLSIHCSRSSHAVAVATLNNLRTNPYSFQAKEGNKAMIKKNKKERDSLRDVIKKEICIEEEETDSRKEIRKRGGRGVKEECTEE
jgi:hypothetical protein